MIATFRGMLYTVQQIFAEKEFKDDEGDIEDFLFQAKRLLKDTGFDVDEEDLIDGGLDKSWQYWDEYVKVLTLEEFKNLPKGEFHHLNKRYHLIKVVKSATDGSSVMQMSGQLNDGELEVLTRKMK